MEQVEQGAIAWDYLTMWHAGDFEILCVWTQHKLFIITASAASPSPRSRDEELTNGMSSNVHIIIQIV